MECKKKQDILLKSGQWLSNSPALNKKNYTSDYILNKAAEVGLEIPIDILNQNIPTQTKSSKRQLPNLNKIKQNSLDHHDNLIIDDSTNQRNSNNRSNLIQSNSAQSVPDLTHDDDDSINNQTTKSSYLNQETNNDNSDNQFSAPTPLINTRKSRLRQSLIKQASLNNPPNYYKDLNEDNFENQDESSYEKSRHHSTSNKELRKTTSSLINTTSNNDNQYFSSPSSSISHLNSTSFSHGKADRIQDPLILLKKSSSRLNSVNNLTDSITDETALFLNNNKKHETTTINAINVIKQPATVGAPPVRTSSISKRARELVKQPDSLSSDPSDILNNRDIDQEENDILTRKHSKTKRAMTNPTRLNNNQRKQPTLPTLLMNSNHLAAHQQKLLAKLNLKQQNSLTSSDDENITTNESNSRNLRNQLEKNDSLENEIEEPEEEFNESEEINNEDIDEEIRSTTEYTTNDEMDLESGSVSLNANNLNRTRLLNTQINNKNNNIIGINNMNNTNQKSIDNYLEQNLHKDEILAAKMTKFLSVCITYFLSIIIKKE